MPPGTPIPDPLRVAAIQMEHRRDLDQNLLEAERLLREARDQHVALVLLPEYFYARLTGEPEHDASTVHRFLERMSRDLDLAIAANVIETTDGGTANLGVVYSEGRQALVQPKVHPMPRETEEGILAGDRFGIGHVAGRPVGMLVCSDVLYPEAPRILALQGAQILLNPVMSPYRTDDPTLEAREAMYIARAYDAGAFVIKAGGFRRNDPPIAGRSLITAPWGILAHYQEPFTPEVLTADLDFTRLDAFRMHQQNFPLRRPEVYHELATPGSTSGTTPQGERS